MKSLRRKLVLSVSALLLLSIGALSLIFNYSIDGLFEEYAYYQQEQQVKQIVEQINAQYLPSIASYNMAGLEVIGNAALQSGIMVHVQTINKELDWDISTHKSQECQLMLQHTEENMHSRYPNFQGGLEQKEYDLFYQGVQVGYLTLGFYGPYSFNESELRLLNSLNGLIIGLGIVFLLAAIGLGSYIATRLTKPIRTVVKVTQKIAEGDYGTQITEQFHTSEVVTLIQAVNEMSVALRRKDQQKRQLTADVAHELRTPLSNLQSHMEAIIDEVWEPTPELFQSCHDEILRLTNIVNQLQELNQLEDGKIELNKSTFTVGELLDGLVRDFSMTAKEKGIVLMSDAPEPSANLSADLCRLKQCMINLIANAIHASADGGVITLAHRSQKDADYLAVADHGKGIPSEELPQIFERFYRVDKSRNQKTGGMGIGLSITKAIVEAHQGKIEVTSALGAGTTFTIILPKQ
ncbi:MAG: HAMP domain-containing sensor histidine kinase [Oscillospiraceae bacterium]|nr:HAMP domain-containing sensor histidine kinase [Oscillospiraceae bacterium]